MKLDSIRIVLVATSHPGNIGSVARAMKTMGLGRLYLVTPKHFPDRKAQELAAGADDVLEHAVITENLVQALQGCQLVLATSARAREIALPGLTPKESVSVVQNQPDGTEVAFVFGREHAGLTNDELLRSHYHVHIPSDPIFSSLNLAQSVQIIAYELRIGLLSPGSHVATSADGLASVEAVEQFYAHLERVLIAVDFLKPSNPKRLLQRLRRLFNRIKLEQLEVNILRGMLTHVQRALGKGRG